MLKTVLLSSVERLLANDWKATKRPDREMSALPESSLPGAPATPVRAADQRVRGGGEVAHEDVRGGVVVLNGQVVGARLEGDPGAVPRDRRREGVVVGAGAARPRARGSRGSWCWLPGRARRCSRARCRLRPRGCWRATRRRPGCRRPRSTGLNESSLPPAPLAPERAAHEGRRVGDQVAHEDVRGRRCRRRSRGCGPGRRTRRSARPPRSPGRARSRSRRRRAGPTPGSRAWWCSRPRRARRRSRCRCRPRPRGCPRRCRRRPARRSPRSRGGLASPSAGAPGGAGGPRDQDQVVLGRQGGCRQRGRGGGGEAASDQDGRGPHAASPGRPRSGWPGAGRRPTGRSPGAG